MARHKFKQGQSVRYLASNQARLPAGIFKILQLLPAAGSDQQYRLKNASEPYERIALESQLALATDF